VQREDGRITLRVAKEQTAKATERLLATLPVMDLTVEDPPIDEVIERVFAGAAPDGPPGGRPAARTGDG
jgi:ABC-2 type transport system ATP-binding protein